MLPDDHHRSGTDLVALPPARPLQLALAEDLARADDAELRAYAGNTKRAYLADLAHFGTYAVMHNLATIEHHVAGGAELRRIRIPADPIDVDLVRAYLSYAEGTGLRFATLQRRVA